MNKKRNGFMCCLVFSAVFLISATPVAFGQSLYAQHGPLEQHFGFGSWSAHYGFTVNFGISLIGAADLTLGGDVLSVSEMGRARLDTWYDRLSFEGYLNGGTATMNFGLAGGLSAQLCISEVDFCMNVPIPFGYNSFLLSDTTTWTPYFSPSVISIGDGFAPRVIESFGIDNSVVTGTIAIEGSGTINHNLTPESLSTSRGTFVNDTDTQTLPVICDGEMGVSNMVKHWNWDGSMHATLYVTGTLEAGWFLDYQIRQEIKSFDVALSEVGLNGSFSTEPAVVAFDSLGGFAAPVVGHEWIGDDTLCAYLNTYCFIASLPPPAPEGIVFWSWASNHGGTFDGYGMSPHNDTGCWVPAVNGYNGPVTITATATVDGCSKSTSVVIYLRQPLDPPNTPTISEGCNYIDVSWDPVPGADTYDIYRDGQPSPYTYVKTTSWRDTIPGTSSHCYQVMTNGTCGFGILKSDPVCGTANPAALPTQPGPISAVSLQQRCIVSWDPVEGASEYCLYRDGALLSCRIFTSIVDSLPDTLEHCYSVIARNSCGDSPESESTCVTATCPDTIEVCNGIDDNCDGQIDEGFATFTSYADADGDGYGDLTHAVVLCYRPLGYVDDDSSDCDDADAAVHPGAVEVCNGIDDNCDGTVDEGFFPFPSYADADGDGYGDLANKVEYCFVPPGYVDDDSSDCDDANAAVHPGAVEVCNGIDDNCDGYVDEGVEMFWYEDADGDGFGNGASGAVSSCSQPAGYVDDGWDCDDGDSTIHPGAVDVAGDGIDQNCNGIDGNYLCYFDVDGDGYGGTIGPIVQESPCTGYLSPNQLDCQDNNAAIHPGAPDSLGDGIDQNCDGVDGVNCPVVMTGDVNESGNLTSADIIGLVNYVFKGGAAPQPIPEAGDADCSGAVTASDIIQMVNHVFKGGPAPCDVCSILN